MTNTECSSTSKLDVIFAIDNSGDIGTLDLRKEVVREITEGNVAADLRVGLTAFGDIVDVHSSLQHWTSNRAIKDNLKSIPATISRFALSLDMICSWFLLYILLLLACAASGFLYIQQQSEVDVNSMILSALNQFSSSQEAEREQLLIIITNHNPIALCQLAPQVQASRVRVIVIADGQADALYTSCILQSPDDFVYVEALATADFDAITTRILPVICPSDTGQEQDPVVPQLVPFVLDREVIITEIKPLRNSLCSACNRFVEIYNKGARLDASTLTLSGVIEGNGPQGIVVETNQYVVFYDAANNDREPAAITCVLCQDTGCDMSECVETSIICRCSNAVYVPCGNTADIDDGYTCSFQDSARNTQFYMAVSDALNGEILDEVQWNVNSWIIIQDGFSYELLSKEANNDWGDNWVQSCTVYGTPGSDPKPTCAAQCTSNSCKPFECGSDGQCECSLFGIFYPSCNGGSCRQCKVTPIVSECNVTWIINDTADFALFEWTPIDMGLDHGYKLSYFAADGNTKNVVFSGSDILRYIANDYNPREYQVGGYIISTVNIDGVEYNSDGTFCHILNPITTSSSPTPSPTDRPQRVCCNCLRESNDGGCIDTDCEAFICNLDQFCCEHTWDQVCAIRSYAICTYQSIPGCCECASSPDVGCSNFECLQQVCRDDPYCCGTDEDDDGYWDSFCVSAALDICQSIVA